MGFAVLALRSMPYAVGERGFQTVEIAPPDVDVLIGHQPRQLAFRIGAIEVDRGVAQAVVEGRQVAGQFQGAGRAHGVADEALGVVDVRRFDLNTVADQFRIPPGRRQPCGIAIGPQRRARRPHASEGKRHTVESVGDHVAARKPYAVGVPRDVGRIPTLGHRAVIRVEIHFDFLREGSGGRTEGDNTNKAEQLWNHC